MAFNRNQMSALCYNNGFTMWHYRTEDTLYTVVDVLGYFDEWGEYLRPGDVIIVNASTDNDWVFVQSVQDGVVAVS